jgi:serine/threonine protein phosphatase PrpC
MQPTRLRGADHEMIGEIAALAEGCAAIALSRGGAAKTYRYRHANEDAAGFAHGEAGSLALVADGHGGREAAELAVAWALEELAPRWTDPGAQDLRSRFEREARSAAAALHSHILRASLGIDSQPCRTTLSLALVRPAEGWFGHWSVGDSHVFEVAGGVAREPCALPEGSAAFLGDAAAGEALGEYVRIGVGELADSRCLVLATDGLSEVGIGVANPAGVVAEVVSETARQAPDLRPLAAARALVERALASHRARRSGDNVATAVLWRLDEGGSPVTARPTGEPTRPD